MIRNDFCKFYLYEIVFWILLFPVFGFGQEYSVDFNKDNYNYIEITIDLREVPKNIIYEDVGCVLNFYDWNNNLVDQKSFILTDSELPKLKAGRIYQRLILHEVSSASFVSGIGLYSNSRAIGTKVDDPNSNSEQLADNNSDKIQATTIFINLLTNNGHFVVAKDGGSDKVEADRSVADLWETFLLVDLNGGKLISGDLVNLRSQNLCYLVAEHGGGAEVRADRNQADKWETFTIIKVNGGEEIKYNDLIALRAYNGQFVVAEGGGGGKVKANRNSISFWETFKLIEPGWWIINKW